MRLDTRVSAPLSAPPPPPPLLNHQLPLYFFWAGPWNCTSFLNLSSKCATSPVSCCSRGREKGWRGGGLIGEEKSGELGCVCVCVWHVYGTQRRRRRQRFTSLFHCALFLFSYLRCHHSISVPAAAGVPAGGVEGRDAGAAIGLAFRVCVCARARVLRARKLHSHESTLVFRLCFARLLLFAVYFRGYGRNTKYSEHVHIAELACLKIPA